MPRKKSAAKKAREAAAREAAAKIADIEERTQLTENDVKEPRPEPKAEPKAEADSESESDSESEIEDELGDLVTEEIEHGIQEVMNAIKSNDTKKLLDPTVKFFSDPDAVPVNDKARISEKPLYLKDYHRMNLLSGADYYQDEDASHTNSNIQTIDGKPSFVEMQKIEKEKLLSEIRDAFNDTTTKTGDNTSDKAEESDDDDEFLKKKEVVSKDTTTTTAKFKTGNHTGSIPLPEATEENTDEFLKAYLDNQAWIPKPGDKMQLNSTEKSMEADADADADADSVAEAEEDDDEFDRAAEDFENAYNFRYEDPNSAEIISYARNLATLRRSATSSRRRKRDEAKQVKEAEKREKQQEIQKRKVKTVNKLSDMLEQFKEEYGAELDEKMVEKVASKLLNSDYSEDQWDSVLAELFDDEFYGEQGSEKPSWDDMDEFKEEEEEEEGYNGEEQQQQDNSEAKEEEPSKKEKSKKQALRDEKMRKRKEKQKLVDIVDKAVEQNKLSIIEQVENERGRSREREDVKFRYREVSPESYGLSARDIFAAEDADLNEFISLKKFAPYRPQELKKKDKRKVMKSKRIAEWRKKVFHNENGPQFDEESGNLLIETAENTDVGSKRRHRRHKDHHKKGHKRTKMDR